MQKSKVPIPELLRTNLDDSKYVVLDWKSQDQVNALANTILETASAPVADYQWNDANFNAKWLPLVQSYKAPSIAEMVNLCKHFLNLVASGVSDPNLSALDVVYLMIRAYNIDGRYPCRIDVANAMTENFPTISNAVIIKDANLFSWGGARAGGAKMTKTWDSNGYKVTWEQTKAIEWYHQVWNILSQPGPSGSTDAMSNSSFSSIQAKLTFYCFYLLRMITKPYESVISNLAVGIGGKINKFFSEEDNVTMFPPPSSSLESSLGLKLSNKDSMEVRRIIVALTYIACFRPQELRSDVDKHLKASCLLSLTETGLGPLHWLSEACAAQGVQPKILLETIQSGPEDQLFGFKIQH